MLGIISTGEGVCSHKQQLHRESLHCSCISMLGLITADLGCLIV